ncbi:MAG: hypothetical protein ABW360_03930 [Phenylobacterium sp.]
MGNLRHFLDQIETDPSRSGLDRACHALSWHISDQYGAYDELPVIAGFNDRVRKIARAIETTDCGDTDCGDRSTIPLPPD